jgi:Flp pilus assembly protein TadG
MNTLQVTERRQKRRQGQTLAEFAITLPILLILTFGIIEFGRIFQAWVTLQNAARAGARYASTGQYDESRYVMDLEFLDTTTNPQGQIVRDMNDPDGFIPCVDDGIEDDRSYPSWTNHTADQRGDIVTIHPNGGGSEDAIQVYTNGLESLFATWNFGRNCDPRSEEDQSRRRDMARILSIMEEARKGAAGLYLEASNLNIPSDKTDITGWPWFEVWKVPFANEEQKAWFNVTVCSTRRMLDTQNSTNYYSRVDDTGEVKISTRFVQYLGDTVLRDAEGRDLSASETSNPRLPSVGCLLNENLASTAGGLLNNAGKPWMDPGGPSDTVTVIVTFNHPLVTPLGLAPYIRMQARRSAIVESFRAADPQNAFSDVPITEQEGPTDTPTMTFTPSLTFTATHTPTYTPTPTPTMSRTPPPPFQCSLITVNPVENGQWDGLFSNSVALEIHNGNTLPTFLTRVIFRWPTISSYSSMYMGQMALNGTPHWKGQDRTDANSQFNVTDTNTDSSIPSNYFVNTPEEDRTIAGNDTGEWTATFGNGPNFPQFQTANPWFSINSFGGTEFYLFNPNDPMNPCVIPLALTPPPPTNTPDPNAPPPTATFTPDCLAQQMTVGFKAFEQFGILHLEVTNNRTIESVLVDFTIVWKQKLPGVLTLDRVTLVAPPGQPGSVEVWNSGSPTEDKQPNTSGRGEGVWVQNFTFPPNSKTQLYVDFGGVGGLLSDNGIGMVRSDFNGTNFRITCGTDGTGNGGMGTVPTGQFNLAEVPTPGPSNTPGPSKTPRPTSPPTAVPTKGPPTNTPKPGPTNTPRPTNTPAPPPTATKKPPPPTLPGGGCVDGCG